MPPPRGTRTVHELTRDSRKGKKMEKKPGAALLLWGGIAATVLAVALVLAVVFWPSSGSQLSEDQLQQEREKMKQQLHQIQQGDKGKKK
jgi:Tfp pilus assembly protein PilN